MTHFCVSLSQNKMSRLLLTCRGARYERLKIRKYKNLFSTPPTRGARCLARLIWETICRARCLSDAFKSHLCHSSDSPTMKMLFLNKKKRILFLRETTSANPAHSRIGDSFVGTGRRYFRRKRRTCRFSSSTGPEHPP